MTIVSTSLKLQDLAIHFGIPTEEFSQFSQSTGRFVRPDKDLIGSIVSFSLIVRGELRVRAETEVNDRFSASASLEGAIELRDEQSPGMSNRYRSHLASPGAITTIACCHSQGETKSRLYRTAARFKSSDTRELPRSVSMLRGSRATCVYVCVCACMYVYALRAARLITSGLLCSTTET